MPANSGFCWTRAAVRRRQRLGTRITRPDSRRGGRTHEDGSVTCSGEFRSCAEAGRVDSVIPRGGSRATAVAEVTLRPDEGRSVSGNRPVERKRFR